MPEILPLLFLTSPRTPSSDSLKETISMEFLKLLFTASIPVMEVLLVTAIGLLIATDRIGIFGPDARHYMNHIVFYVFTPALVASNLANTITVDNLLQMWFMPINILITFLLGSALGYILIKLTRAPLQLRAVILGVCSAGNLGNLPIIIIPAICQQPGNPFGNPANCHSYGMAYASLSMAIGVIYIWSYTYNIMRVFSCTEEVLLNGSSNNIQFPTETSELLRESSTEPLLPSKDCVISEDPADQLAQPYPRYEEKVPFLVKCISCSKMFAEKINLKKIFAPATCGTIVGFIVGLVPQIRKAVIGDTAPLRAIQSSTDLLGQGSIPAMTLIIGGNLLRGLKGPGMKKSIVIGVMVVRYIFMPLIGIVVVKTAHHIGFVHSDPLYQFVLLLQFALPPAASIGTITQLFAAGEKECSVIMLWTYIFASITITIWATFYMWFVA